MNRLLGITKKEWTTILSFFVIYRLLVFIPVLISESLIPQNNLYAGPSPWSNFDGMHYLSIAQSGYTRFQHAFFPAFPLLIRALGNIFDSYRLAAHLIVNLSTLLTMVVLYKLVKLDYKQTVARRAVISFLVFPTTFFCVAIYTESVFLLLTLLSVYLLRTGRKYKSVAAASLATATRLVGVVLIPLFIIELIKDKIRSLTFKKFIKDNAILLLIPVGLLAYMSYLYFNFRDPLFFFSVQPEFGAGRSGSEIIFLPQVIWRYSKILVSVPSTSITLWIAVFELFMTTIAGLIILLALKKKLRLSYIVFSSLVIVIPTLTGTLSSMPRYLLACFIMYFYFATIKNNLARRSILVASAILQIAALMLFSAGYFVA